MTTGTPVASSIVRGQRDAVFGIVAGNARDGLARIHARPRSGAGRIVSQVKRKASRSITSQSARRAASATVRPAARPLEFGGQNVSERQQGDERRRDEHRAVVRQRAPLDPMQRCLVVTGA